MITRKPSILLMEFELPECLHPMNLEEEVVKQNRSNFFYQAKQSSTQKLSVILESCFRFLTTKKPLKSINYSKSSRSYKSRSNIQLAENEFYLVWSSVQLSFVSGGKLRHQLYTDNLFEIEIKNK